MHALIASRHHVYTVFFPNFYPFSDSRLPPPYFVISSAIYVHRISRVTGEDNRVHEVYDTGEISTIFENSNTLVKRVISFIIIGRKRNLTRSMPRECYVFRLADCNRMKYATP